MLYEVITDIIDDRVIGGDREPVKLEENQFAHESARHVMCRGFARARLRVSAERTFDQGARIIRICQSHPFRERSGGEGICAFHEGHNQRIWLKNSRVRSFRGWSKNSCGVFCSTICPASMNRTRSATLVITSYSIHYTKLYEGACRRLPGVWPRHGRR